MILSDDFPKCKNAPKILSRIKGFSNWVQRGLFCSAGRTDKNAVAISSHKSFLALQMSFMYTIYTFNIKYTVYCINGQMHICISRSCSWPIHSIQSVIIFFFCVILVIYTWIYIYRTLTVSLVQFSVKFTLLECQENILNVTFDSIYVYDVLMNTYLENIALQFG